MHSNIRKPRMKMGRPRPQMHDGSSSHHHSGSFQDKHDRIDSRCRHNSQYLRQFVDKYLNFAREAMGSGDRIAAEGFFQHADHYQRLLNEKIQERAMLEKSQQRDVMEAQIEPATIDTSNAESVADSTKPRIKTKKPAAEQLAPIASDGDTAGQLSEQAI